MGPLGRAGPNFKAKLPAILSVYVTRQRPFENAVAFVQPVPRTGSRSIGLKNGEPSTGPQPGLPVPAE
eukprot:625018-Hanusia_phi.AAC.1